MNLRSIMKAYSNETVKRKKPEEKATILDFFDTVKETVSHAWRTHSTPFLFETKNGECMITGYKECMIPKIEITTDLYKKPVTAIGIRAFIGCKFLQNVFIDEGVKTIESNAFSTCMHLKTVEMANNSIETIGDNAFYECENLFYIKFSDNLKSIGARAFYGCIGLRDIEIPSGVTSVGFMSFANCQFLKSVKIPSSVNNIARSTFEKCENLSDIYVGEGSFTDRLFSASPVLAPKIKRYPGL